MPINNYAPPENTEESTLMQKLEAWLKAVTAYLKEEKGEGRLFTVYIDKNISLARAINMGPFKVANLQIVKIGSRQDVTTYMKPLYLLKQWRAGLLGLFQVETPLSNWLKDILTVKLTIAIFLIKFKKYNQENEKFYEKKYAQLRTVTTPDKNEVTTKEDTNETDNWREFWPHPDSTGNPEDIQRIFLWILMLTLISGKINELILKPKFLDYVKDQLKKQREHIEANTQNKKTPQKPNPISPQPQPQPQPQRTNIK